MKEELIRLLAYVYLTYAITKIGRAAAYYVLDIWEDMRIAVFVAFVSFVIDMFIVHLICLSVYKIYDLIRF